jgi:hypothetical protein
MKGGVHMKDRRNQRGFSGIEYSMMIALFVALLIVIAPYIQNSAGGKLQGLADQMSEQKFDPRESTFEIHSVSGAISDTTTTTTGISTTNVTAANSRRDIDESLDAPEDGLDAFDSAW